MDRDLKISWMSRCAAIFAVIFMSSCTLSGGPDIEYVMSNKVNFVDAAKWKEGRDCSLYILGFIGPFGTKSLVRAAQASKIRKLHYFERQWKYYVSHSESCIIAYGR